MKRLTKKPWFGPKKLIGWGWAPSSLEGWTITIAWLIVLIYVISTKQLTTKTRPVFAISMLLVFLIIIMLTGDKPGWGSLNKK